MLFLHSNRAVTKTPPIPDMPQWGPPVPGALDTLSLPTAHCVRLPLYPHYEAFLGSEWCGLLGPEQGRVGAQIGYSLFSY